MEGERGSLVINGQFWEEVLIVQLHGNEVREDVLESGGGDVVEGLDVVLSRKTQTERLLIVHYIINDHF